MSLSTSVSLHLHMEMVSFKSEGNLTSAKAPSMSFAILTDSSDSSESPKGGGSSKGGGGGRLFGQPGESQRGP